MNVEKVKRGSGLVAVNMVDVTPHNRSELGQVIALGDQYRQTLGFLPQQVFEQAAENGTLIAAVRYDRVLAYALYSLPRQVIRLTHLCVSEHARGEGLARRLVDEISERHVNRLGITLKCRSDYAENSIWPRLGFRKQGEKPGRGKQRLPLAIWWRDHGHPALFSATESLGLLRVMMDLNVFADIESGYDREGALESVSLVQDWLVDQVDLVVSSELLREISRLDSGPEKARQLRALARYWRVDADPAAVDAHARHIRDHVLKKQGIDLSLDKGDVSDVRHLAEASLTGVTVLATRDAKFIEWSAATIDVTGVRVMRPSDVIVHVDELARAQTYRPIQLQDSQYALTPVRSQSEAELLKFMHGDQGERKPQYLALIRSLLAQGPRWTRLILRDPHNNPIGFYTAGLDAGQVIVPILRVNSPNIEETVIRQLLFILRELARAEGCSIIRITDPMLADSMKRAAREDGFIYHRDNWIALVISVCAEAATVDEHVTSVTEQVNLCVPGLRPNMSATVAAELERTLWPAKIIDSALPTFIVPIRPTWSAELFGVPQILMPRRNTLGISREHVYYRSPRPRIVQAPARLLWYASGSGRRDGVGAIIACSRLEEVISAKPTALHQRYRHLGVWQQQQVSQVAQHGVALALRFADTEVFPHQIPWHRLQQLASPKRRYLTLQSPQKISAELFATVYQEGHMGHERSG